MEPSRHHALEVELKRLLLSARAGDAFAYHAFLRALGDRLRAFVRRRLNAMPDEVEDLVQEALLAVHLNRHTYDVAQPVTSWARGIAAHKLADFFRGRASDEWRVEWIDDDVHAAPASDREANDARLDVELLLGELSDRQRLSIVYTKLDGLSVAEAAERAGTSEAAVKVAVHRGLKVLRRRAARAS